MKTVLCYTDASHCHHTRLGACGFVLLSSGKVINHRVLLVGGLKRSGDAECYAATAALQEAFMVEGVQKIILLSDFMAIVKHKPGVEWPFAPEFWETVEMIRETGIKFIMTYVKAHAENHMNNKVDASCRQELKKYKQQKGLWINKT